MRRRFPLAAVLAGWTALLGACGSEPSTDSGGKAAAAAVADWRAELWKGRPPAGGQATPMTYRLRPDGRQYVVIAAGGHGRLGTKLGDALVAFALPLPKP